MSAGATGRIVAVNQSWLDLFGYDPDEVIGRTNRELGVSINPDPRQSTAEFVRGGSPATNMEMKLRRKSGEVRDVIVSVVPVQFGADTGYLLSALTDVTALKRAEAERDQLTQEATASQERLGALSRRLLTAQEEERRHLAVELHDELGQVLTAVKINLESLERSLAPGALPALKGAIESVNHAMHRVRDIAFDLRPSVLDDLGLPPALRWYVDRFARLARIEAHVAIDAIPDIDPNIATACFRVAQEALTNVARHAHARNVWLELHLVADGLELRVVDDGAGFDQPSARKRAMEGESMGLLGMEERVSLVGGKLEIRAAAGQGCRICARFPMDEKFRKRP
jgi:PAS domain S-box-containing protein